MIVVSNSPPVIDVSDAERANVHKQIDDACREWGMFQIVGHGLDARMFAALRRQMRALFSLPLDEKLVIARSAKNPWGFYDRELTRHTRDWKQVYDFGPADGGDLVPQFPAKLPAFEPIIRAFYDACDELSLRLVRIMARNLGMPPESLDAHFRPAHTSFVRYNYYPACPQPVKPLGVNPHTDSGAVTLLVQDAPALEVSRKEQWWLVEPVPGAITVNIGDVMQVWSNDEYTAPLHRVLATEEERFSAPFFFNPSYATNYAPLPSVVDSRHPPRYRPINWRQFRDQRAAGDYADAGEYMQISRYAIRGS